MAGHVQYRGNGSYLLVYHIGYDANGKRIRKTKTVKAKNKREALKKLAEFVTEIENGLYIEPSRTKFGEFVKIWKKQVEKELAPNTIEMYNYQLNGRILPAFSHMKLEDISHIHINNYLDSLENENLSSSTIQKHFNILSSIFRLAEKYELIKSNPMKKAYKPKVTYKQFQVYNSSELKLLHQLLNKEENKQQVLIVKLALTTGMRKGEILALQWDDIDFETNTINIRHSLCYTKANGYELRKPKTKSSIRKVAPPKKLMEQLKQHKLVKMKERLEAAELWQGGKYFFVFSSTFGKPLYPDVPNKWWSRFLERTNKYLIANNQKPLKKIRFHDLRHCAATDLINRGIHPYSISKRLGHSNISTTMDVYGHYLEEADQKIADMLNEDYI